MEHHCLQNYILSFGIGWILEVTGLPGTILCYWVDISCKIEIVLLTTNALTGFDAIFQETPPESTASKQAPIDDPESEDEMSRHKDQGFFGLGSDLFSVCILMFLYVLQGLYLDCIQYYSAFIIYIFMFCKNILDKSPWM